jgi:hypothetical protein
MTAQMSMPPSSVESVPVFEVDQFGNQLQDNQDGIALITAVLATSNQASQDQQQTGQRGVKLFLNVTTIGIGGALVPIVEVKDLISGLYVALFTLSVPVAANGLFMYTIYPGLTVGTTVVSDVLTRTWRARVTGLAAGGSSFTLGGAYLA